MEAVLLIKYELLEKILVDWVGNVIQFIVYLFFLTITLLIYRHYSFDQATSLTLVLIVLCFAIFIFVDLGFILILLAHKAICQVQKKRLKKFWNKYRR